MRVWTSAASFCAVAVLCTVGASSGAGTGGQMMAPNLTGQMAGMRYLIGIWTCSVKLAAMNGGPAETTTGTVAFATAPGNTMRVATRSLEYSADEYDGYDAKAKVWWSSSVDVFSALSHETSKDGKTFVGTLTMGGGTVPVRDIRTKFSTTKIEDVSEMKQGAAWTQTADAVCTK